MTCYCCGAEILSGDYCDGIGPLCELCITADEEENDEAEFWKYLHTGLNEGFYEYVLRQIPFDIPGGYRHRVDFMAVMSVHGYKEIAYYEVKGKDIGTGKLKRKQVEEIYGIKIHVMRAKYRSGTIVGFEEVET